MKTQQTTISEVRLVYRTKIKASDRLQVKCSKDAFDIFMESRDLDSIEHVKEFKLMFPGQASRPRYSLPLTLFSPHTLLTENRLSRFFC
jgi:hypothetical protein